MSSIVLTLCAPCLGAGAAAAVAELRLALGRGVRVEAGACLGPCEAPVALALQGRGAAYVFAGIRLPCDATDIAATCAAYRAAPAGWIEDARPCGRLRFCLRARVPAPD